MLGMALAGLLGCLWAPLWAGLLGLGQGGQFSVALLLVGLLHDATGGWGAVAGLFMLLTAAAAAAGWWAGQNRQV